MGGDVYANSANEESSRMWFIISHSLLLSLVMPLLV